MLNSLSKDKPREILNIEYKGNSEIGKREGTYHDYNRLNNLTSKEWIKFQKSWFIINPKSRKKDVMMHPAKFPEELIENFIRFFTKEGQTVFDPMVGTGSTLLAAMNTNRNAIGIELSKKYANVAAQRINDESEMMNNSGDKNNIKLYNGDARMLDRIISSNIDYCITSPPYWDMLREKGFETQKTREKMNYDTHYSEDGRDVGNIEDYMRFLDELKEIYLKVHSVMKIGGYLTVIVKNIKKGGKIYPLAWDLTKKLEFFTLKDEKIWCQDNVKLAPYGYGYSWVSNTVHHYCLIFKKE
tara:strand:- start:6633 stop:7529 length:897 start_codon:yes stop_codon:yes gene_type:complete